MYRIGFILLRAWKKVNQNKADRQVKQVWFAHSQLTRPQAFPDLESLFENREGYRPLQEFFASLRPKGDADENGWRGI
jgi:hypothetical protein